MPAHTETLANRTINYRGTEYEIEVTRRPEYHRPGLYLSGWPDPAPERPEYLPKGVNPEVDEAWKAYNRAEVRTMQTLIDIVADVLPFDVTGLRFSRKCGCPCGCSGGFPLRKVKSYHDYSIHLRPVGESDGTES